MNLSAFVTTLVKAHLAPAARATGMARWTLYQVLQPSSSSDISSPTRPVSATGGIPSTENDGKFSRFQSEYLNLAVRSSFGLLPSISEPFGLVASRSNMNNNHKAPEVISEAEPVAPSLY